VAELIRFHRPIVSRFERFFAQYEEFLDKRSRDLAFLMREEVPDAFASDVCDPMAEKRWRDWLDFVESEASFQEKFDRYQELKRSVLKIN
jgi:hypothetical protein